jgi:Protein of unknown function (DUF3592)
MAHAKKIKDRIWLWGLISALMLLIAPFVFVLMGEATADNDRYRSEGRVGQGVVTAVRAVEESYTGRRGRPKTRTDHFIDVSYDLYPSIAYADYAAGGEVLPLGGGSANHSYASISSSSAEAEAHRTGQAVAVVVLPDDPFAPRLYTAVRDYSNWPNYLLMLGALLSSAVCGWRALVAWRELKLGSVLPMGRTA